MSKLANKFEARSFSAYNKKADDYENTFDGRFTQKFKALLVENVALQEGDHVLDVACGNGRLLHMFAEQCAIHGYGADLSDKMIEQARLLNPSMDFRVGRCEDLPFEDSAFDVITVCAAYHHFPDVKGFAKEAARLLKAQGAIYIADVYYPWPIRTIANPFVRLSKAGDVKFYAPREIIATLEEAGFQIGTYRIDGHIQIIRACFG
jgi:ubiquinone/menaquinone biosynthesis C-methylase UbiE